MNDASKIQIPLLMGEVRGREIVDGQNNIICYQSDIDMKISRIAKNVSLFTMNFALKPPGVIYMYAEYAQFANFC